MAINTDHYTDAKAAQAHLGFLLLLVLDLLSKDNIDSAQSLATVFISIAIPSLIITLIALPKEDLIDFPKFQFQIAIISNLVGHFSGIIALATILFGFNIFAGVVFSLVATLSYAVFTLMVCHQYGYQTLMDLVNAVFSKQPATSASPQEYATPLQQDTEATPEALNRTPT